MIYEKLPVSFLMALASEKAGSATSAIARTLLENRLMLGLMREKLMLPRIWMVSGEEKPREEYIDGVILYRSHAQAGHPYQLQFIAGLIAQEYAAMLDERGEADGDRD